MEIIILPGSEARSLVNPYGHLEAFYGLIGFKKISPESGPPYLYTRLLEYLKKEDTIMMKRDGS
jgi:hypothetical protein